jgi:hypothetical protein
MFRDFRRRLFHGCLTVINEPLKPFMHNWDIVRCADHHFRRAIYGLGPYIADYPEQTAASGVVYNWCVTFVHFDVRYPGPTTHFVRCDAHPSNLDDPNANLRTRERTATLLNNEDPESLWYGHGIVPEFEVCYRSVTTLIQLSSKHSHLR